MDKTIMIVDLYKCEKDKTRIFSSIYNLWYEIIRLDIPEELKSKYLKFILESLKMNVFFFNKVGYTDYRVFLRRFIKLISVNPMSKVEAINKLLEEYNNLYDGVTWHYTFIDKIGSLDIDFEEKAHYIMIMWDYIRDLFASLEYYDVKEEVKTSLMYGFDSLFDEDITDLQISLTDRAYSILKKFYENESFDPLKNRDSNLDDFLKDLDLAEKKVWTKYQIALIAGTNNINLVFDGDNEIELFASIKKHFIKYALDKQAIM